MIFNLLTLISGKRPAALVPALVTGLWLGCAPLKAQTAQEDFGKNRIQYRLFNWKSLGTGSTDIYFYEGGENLARTAAEIAEQEFRRTSDLFGFTPVHKIKVFVYLSSNDRLMSNVGLEESSTLTGGKTNFTKSMAEVAYEGSLGQFRKQIAAGMAQILIRDMLFGGSIKDMVQSSYLLTLPDWFMGGVIRYASETGLPETEDLLRELSSQSRLRQPANYVGKEAYLIGHSIWNYIADRYGRSTIGNILNLTRIIRNEERAIEGTLGMRFPLFLREWKQYYTSSQLNQGFFLTAPSASQRISRNLLRKNYRQLTTSADGQHLIFAQDWKGKFQVVVTGIRTGKRRVVLRGGSKALHQKSEGEFPVLATGPEGELWVAYPRHGKWKGIRMNLNGRSRRRTHIFDSFEEVYGIQVSPDGRHLAVSGSKDGFSDLFLVSPGGEKTIRLTQDAFDDLDPFFSTRGDSIFWASSRPQTDSATGGTRSLPDTRRKLSIFGIPLQGGNPGLLRQAEGNLWKGRFLKDGSLLCLSDESGIANLALFQPGAEKGVYFTSSLYNLRDYAYQEEMRILATTSQQRMRPYLFLNPAYEPSLYERPLGKEIRPAGDTARIPDMPGRFGAGADSSLTDIRNYRFEEEKRAPGTVLPSPAGKTKPGRAKLRREPRQQPPAELKGPFSYQPQFSASHLTTGMVVDPVPSFGLGALVNFSMNDIFENHRIRGGMTYFFSDPEIRNNKAHLEYEYLKRRVDFRLRAERTSIQGSSLTQFLRQRDILNSVSVAATYPFSNALRAEAVPFFQTTRKMLFDQNQVRLGGLDEWRVFGGIAAQLVFDNTTQTGMNQISGTRFKVRASYQAERENRSQNFGEFFVDFRSCQSLHRELTLAFRASYGSFFGPAAKKYSVGGMDNWLFRTYEVSGSKTDPLRGLNPNNIAGSSEQAQSDWLFNRFCTNLRGFRYNAIFGNSFMLFNWELRIPILRYLYRGPIDSNFWRNLQLTAFTDMGTAWTGVGPLSKNNSLNTQTLSEGNFQISVKSFENPFLTGYGLGARTLLLGYFVKYDLAWGRQNGLTGPPRHYLSLGYDF